MKRFLNRPLSSLTVAAMVTLGAYGASAQELYTGAAWRFGAYGGLNFNIVGAGAQSLAAIAGDASFTEESDIIDGTALGFYTGLMTEYNPGKLFGFQLRAGLDDRRVNFNDWDVADAGRTRFSARMTYVSVEPLLRVNLGSPDFHVTAGPLLSFKIASKYDWVPRDETSQTIVDQEIPGANSFAYGVSGGLAYDILMNSKSTSATKWYLTPFAEVSYMMDQRKNDFAGQDRNDTWVTTSVRGGFQVKFGSGPEGPAPLVMVDEDMPVINLAVRAPNSIVSQRSVIEMFPLRNYLFFEDGSASLPGKYIHLSRDQAQTFQEESMLNDPGTGGGSTMDRSQRQMNVYYQALNIFGDRLRDNPSATIQLVGSAPSQEAGVAMANEVKNYLVTTFGIDAGRITTKGQARPPHASGTRSTPAEDLSLVADENRRVEVLSSDMNLLKPVKLNTMQNEPIDNDLVVDVNTTSPVADYTVAITGEGFSQTYGPFRGTSQRIDARPVLQERSSGSYTATVTARTADNKTVTRTANFNLMRETTPPTTSQRFSILFEYDEAKTVQTYDQFLRQEVAPMIPSNATVVIHGHTDRIGEQDYNYQLSTKRATEAMNVLKDEMRKSGKNVTFDSYGFGEDEPRAPFGNTSAEGRYYNRTVLIEIIPGS